MSRAVRKKPVVHTLPALEPKELVDKREQQYRKGVELVASGLLLMRTAFTDANDGRATAPDEWQNKYNGCRADLHDFEQRAYRECGILNME